MVSKSLRPKMRPKVSILDDLKTDYGYLKAAITGETYNDPNPARTRSRAARSKSMVDKMMSNSDKPSKPKGPTAAQKAAAKLADRKSKGQARRKKYESAMTQSKKMKLLFNY
jgi:hypothetical protein